jgi:AraC family transcriptional regulator of adaptative response/methylated-DNA-[protein]-cysteine methyltransferase
MALDLGHAPDEAEWADLLSRAARDSLYAVVTTGVACRFGCPSRAPLRQNVRVFDGMLAAAAQGFRPCLRCMP